jgi:CheY-like chemotaxis protein
MSKGRVLIVDDELIVLRGYQAELEEAGYYVKGVMSGEEAVDVVEKEEFHIAYVDLMMPGMNGVETCRILKMKYPNMEIILVSGHPTEIKQYQIPFWNAGGRDEILRKPLLENELSQVTEKVLKEMSDRPEWRDG